jgi:AGZA family xanthine/uracil permease-like MFS transporter
MAYIIAVNASIVAETGGTCVCPGLESDPICEKDQDYALCKQSLRRDIVTATAAIAALATFFMGLLANLPVALAPGMGLNAYFAYTVVGKHGTGLVPFRIALTAIFVEGFVFFALAIFGLRQWLARAIPNSIKLATGAGIGMYLTLIGLTYSNGIGVVVGSQATPVTLAGCHPEMRLANGECPSSDKMRNPTMWIGIMCGGVFTTFLMLYRVKGAIIAGILLVSIISWPRGTAVTAFPYDAVGDSGFDFFKKVVSFHPIQSTLNVQDWNIGEYGGQFGLAMLTFLYVDLLDATGTLYAMARVAGLMDPVTQDFEGSAVAYMCDSIAISIGALLGVPPVTTFVESGAGVTEGGKTGITAMVTGFCFFIAVFFAPIFASIPPWATGCVLVLVGSMMASAVVEVNWKYMGDAVPAFLAITVMPFTYSIAYGLIAGCFSYLIINGGVYIIDKISRGKIVPPNYEDREGWTWKIPGGVLPPWMIRLFNGKRDFWREEMAPPEALSAKDVDAASDHGGDHDISASTGQTTHLTEHPEKV